MGPYGGLKFRLVERGPDPFLGNSLEIGGAQRELALVAGEDAYGPGAMARDAITDDTARMRQFQRLLRRGTEKTAAA